jgi:hypothetical protein
MSRLGFIPAPASAGSTDLDGLSDVTLTSPANDDIIQRKSGVFVNRTLTQLKDDLALTTEDIQDLVATLISGNTETGIDVTYDDANNKWDFVARRNGAIAPVDHGLIAWSVDPALVTSAGAPTSGQLRGVMVHIPYATTITNIHMVVATQGSGLTAGQSFAALYSPANALLAVTADQAAAWATTAEKIMALASPQAVAAGLYKVCFWSTGTTPPSFTRAATGGAAAATSLGLNAGSNFRAFTADGGLTTTAPSTIGTQTAATQVTVAALS